MPGEKRNARSRNGRSIAKKSNGRKRQSRKALSDLGIHELNALTISDQTSPGAARPNIISTEPKSNENDVVDAQTRPEAKNAKGQLDKKPRKRKRSQTGGKGPDRTHPAKLNKVEKPGFSAKLTKRGKRLAKKANDQNTVEGEGLLSNVFWSFAFSAKLTKRGKRLAKKANDQNTVEGE
ncbi:hypothetical protein E4U46_001100, partial [Claviceps purpurea]